MGLTSPWALIALVAAALPLIAHLVRRRDLPVTPLPTLALLGRARARSRRRARLVDLLLLATRIAVVAAATLALAQPYVEDRLAYGDGRLATVAIVIDDSASMGVRGGGRSSQLTAADGTSTAIAPTILETLAGEDTALGRAVARAEAAIDALPEGSEVAVVLAGAPARVLLARTTSRDAARRAVRAVAAQPPVRGTDLAGALALAAREVATGRHAVRRALVLSDFAAHAGAAEAEFPDDVALDVERVAAVEGTPPNAAVGPIDVTEDPADPSQLWVSVEVRGWGEAGSGTRRLRVERGRNVLARAEVTLLDGVGRARLRVPAPTEGDPRAWLTLEGEDALRVDDRRGVLLRPRTALRTLHIGPPHALREVGRALDVAPMAEGGRIERRSVDEVAATAADVAGADVVVFTASRPPSPALARALVEHVARGGGLLVAPSGDLDVRPLHHALEEALVVSLDAATSASAVTGLSEGPAASRWAVDAVGVRRTEAARRLVLDRPSPGADVALTWSDGAPALIVGTRGKGRSAVFGSSLDESWSDIPLRPGFPALLVRILHALGPYGPDVGAEVAPGQPAELAWPPGARRLIVTTPSGLQHVLSAPLARPDAAHGAGGDGSPPPRFQHTLEPGAYRVEVDSGGGRVRDLPRLAFVSATPLTESDLAPGELPRARRAGEGRRVGTAAADAGSGAHAGAKVRRDLEPAAWLLAGVLATAEGALRLRRRRRQP